MATKSKHTESQLTVIKLIRSMTYVVYGFTVLAVTSLTIAFFLLLFSANPDTPFVRFVYEVARDFGQPFRGIFPTHPVGETGYLSTTALFAIIMYLLFSAVVHALIEYINLKLLKIQAEIDKIRPS